MLLTLSALSSLLLFLLPQPAPPLAYDVRYEVGGVYEGTAEVVVGDSGSLTGTILIARPMRITADFAGRIDGGRLTFDHAYVLDGCTGRMHGSGTLGPGGAISGDVEIGGPCVPQPLAGTFVFTRRAPSDGGGASVDAASGIRWQPYRLATDEEPIAAELGRLAVPERRGNPASRSITIAFARIRSTSATPGPPIVYLDGGPGGSGIGAARIPHYAGLFRELRRSSDVILLSQRGTGLSDRLGCLGGDPLPADTLTTAARMSAEIASRHAACAASLRAQGADLAGYTSNESADDIDAIRAALGVPKVSLLGFSYGTHLALTTVRRHGGRIARVVLIGTEGPADTWKLPSTYDAQVATIQAMVNADPKARAGMGDFTATLRALLARTAESPIDVTFTAGDTERTMAVGAAGILYLLRRDIGDTNDLTWIPAFVHETAAGDNRILSQLLARRVPGLERGVHMMAAAMDCASAAPADRLARIRVEEPESIFGAMTNFPFPEVCAAAGLEPIGPAFHAPVRSDLPTLFVSGTLDSNTPPAQAEAIMRGFPNASHVVVEGAGHESTLTPSVRERIVTFLEGGVVESATLPGSRIEFRLPRK